jgi:competence protein ComEA
MAKRVIDYRSQHGNFASVDALQDVKGIGPKTIEKLRPFIDAK